MIAKKIPLIYESIKFAVQKLAAALVIWSYWGMGCLKIKLNKENSF